MSRLTDLVVTHRDAPESVRGCSYIWADAFNAALGTVSHIVDEIIDEKDREIRALKAELIDVLAFADCNNDRLEELQR